ncbi:MAG: HAD family hydrolase [Candidatus Kapabacteria bacterium]|nr:HAD family hydrolase [Candidatus Kapabacteria bacterium]
MANLAMFDLDGTLIDSRRGILHSLHLTLDAYGVDRVTDADLTKHIGASLWRIFEHYLHTTDKSVLDAAVAKYRHIYRDGPMFEYDIYEGVVDALQQLHRNDVRVVIATAKAHEYAREVVMTGKLATFVHHVYGSELDGRNVEKNDLIRHVLTAEGVDAGRAVMVGDRHHDIDGAVANGVSSIGVLYGYGTLDELHRANRLVDYASELPVAVSELLAA